MKLNIMRLFAAMVLLVVLARSSGAVSLATDPNAIPGWQGSAFFSNGGALKVNIEFAVYAPGDFGTSAFLGLPAGNDPSAGSDYIYAYEALNNAGGTARLSSLSVGLDPGAVPVGSTNIGFLPAVTAGGVAPSLSQLIPTGNNPKSSAKWTFLSPILGAGTHSRILFFSSPYEPKMILTSIIGGNATLASAAMPSPVPEPGTVVLAAIAFVSVLALGRRARRTR